MAKVRTVKVVYVSSFSGRKRRSFVEATRRPPMAGAPPPLVPEREVPPVPVVVVTSLRRKKERARIRAENRAARLILLESRAKKKIVYE